MKCGILNRKTAELSAKWLNCILIVALLQMASSSSLSTAAGLQQSPDAIVLEEDIGYSVSGNKGELNVRCRVKVLNPDGKDHCVIFLRESDFVKLRKFSGKVYDSEGRVIYSCEKDDVVKYCGYSGYSLYSNVCHRTYHLTSNSYPFVAEWEYSIKYNSLFHWPDWTPQKTIPVELSTYRLTVPHDFDFNTRTMGDITEPSTLRHGNKKTLVWKLRDIPAIEEEDYVAPRISDGIGLTFSPVKFKLGKYGFEGGSWSSLGRDYSDMVKDSYELSSDQRSLCENIMATGNDSRRICAELHEALATRARYVAIQIGIGGWKPSSSKETFSCGYGDCKDLSMLYVSMLRHAGIDAWPALILPRNSGCTDPEFPAINGFSHMILFAVVGKDTLWSDPTCQHCEFGDLPWSDENAYALAIDPTGGHILRTSCSTADDNIIARKASVEVKTNRAIAAEIEFTLTGNPCHLLRSMQDDLDERDFGQYLKNDLFGLSDNFSIDSISCPKSDDGSVACRVNVWGVVRNAIHSVGGKQYLNIAFIEPFRECETVQLSERRAAINMGYPRSYVDTLIITIPEDMSISEMPEDRHVTDTFGTVDISYAMTGNSLTITRNKRTYHYEIDPAQFVEFEEHIAEWEGAVESFVILTKR